MKKILDEAKALGAQITAWRRELHEFPETGLETPGTERRICAHLDELGVKYRSGVGGHGVVATIQGARPGRCLMIRCDCDGLPIKEESGESFSSGNENMHACGHDAHTAMGLGALRLLTARRGELKGTVKMFFQPAEETGEGARAMMNDKALENPAPDAAVALHVSMSGAPRGAFTFIDGAALACMDKFQIDLTGKGSHGAIPEMSRDPIVAAGRVITGLQTIVSRNAPPLCPTVVSVCQFEAGSTYNVIPETARLVGTARTLWPENRDMIERRISAVAALTAESMGVKAETAYTRGAPPLINDSALVRELQKTAARLFGEENSKFVTEPMMAGDDFAYYTEKIPGAMGFFVVPPADGPAYNMHNCHFRIDDTQLWRGSALFAAFALDWLAKGE